MNTEPLFTIISSTPFLLKQVNMTKILNFTLSSIFFIAMAMLFAIQVGKSNETLNVVKNH